MLGINGGEFVLLLVVALVVVGPERLPHYAEQLAVWVRTARRYALTAKERVTEELGEDVADVDWAALDPRRYDPRRIVREALLDTDPSEPARTPRPGGATARGAAGATAARAAARAPAGSAAAAGAATAATAVTAATAAAAGGAGPVGAGDGSTPTGIAPVTSSGAPAAGPSAAPFDDEAT